MLAAYINGATSYDACVEALAELFRSQFGQPAQPLRNLASVSPVTIIVPDLYPVGQEFSGPDREKANTAVRAAFARVFPFAEGAA